MARLLEMKQEGKFTAFPLTGSVEAPLLNHVNKVNRDANKVNRDTANSEEIVCIETMTPLGLPSAKSFDLANADAVKVSLKTLLEHTSRTYFCKLCETNCARKSDHINTHHIKDPKVFCGYCNYSTKCSLSDVQKHVKTVHKEKPMKVENKLSEFRDRMLIWKQRCFPIYDDVIESDQNLFQSTTDQKDEDNSSFSFSKPTETKLFTKEDSIKFSPPIVRSERLGLICKLCGLFCTRTKTDHIFAQHLQDAKVFSCGYCSYRSAKSACQVRRHCSFKHKGETPKCVNRRAEYREEICRLMKQCFPYKTKFHNLNGIKYQCSSVDSAEVNQSHNVCALSDTTVSSAENQQTGNLMSRKTDSFKSETAADVISDNGMPSALNLSLSFQEHNNISPVDLNLGTVQEMTTPQSESLKSTNLLNCNLCSRECSPKQIRRHVMVDHIKKDKLFCQYCSFGVKFSQKLMIRHVRKEHPGKLVKFTNVIAEYEVFYRQLKQMCFTQTNM